MAFSLILGPQMGLMGIGLASIHSLVAALAIKLTFPVLQKAWADVPREALEIAKMGFPESACLYVASSKKSLLARCCH